MEEKIISKSIIQKEFLNYLSIQNVSLSEKDIDSYTNLFYLLSDLLNNKLDPRMSFALFDKLSDVVIETKSEDRQKKIFNILNTFERTKNLLNQEEKEIFTFIIWYANCILIKGDNDEILNGLVDLTSKDKILALKKEYFDITK